MGSMQHFHVYTDLKSGCPETIQVGAFRSLAQAQDVIEQRADEDLKSAGSFMRFNNEVREVSAITSGSRNTGYVEINVKLNGLPLFHKIHRLTRCEEEVCQADIA